MGRHREIIPQLVDVCVSIHDGCGVVLIGSVARGDERPESDIDLNIVFPGDDCPVREGSYVDDDNRWQLVVRDVVDGIRVDVAWETQSALLRRLRSNDVLKCWPFSNGLVLHDPLDIATPCLRIAKQWYRRHADVAERFEREYAEAKRRRCPHPREWR